VGEQQTTKKGFRWSSSLRGLVSCVLGVFRVGRSSWIRSDRQMHPNSFFLYFPNKLSVSLSPFDGLFRREMWRGEKCQPKRKWKLARNRWESLIDVMSYTIDCPSVGKWLGITSFSKRYPLWEWEFYMFTH